MQKIVLIGFLDWTGLYQIGNLSSKNKEALWLR